MKTYSASSHNVQRSWYIIDANNLTLGRLAAEIARRLRGKHKAIYTPHVDTGDYVVVVNAEKVRVTGNKELAKIYYRHSGYPGGIYQMDLKSMRANHPTRILEKAVRGMLPKNKLGRAMFTKLKCYAGDAHPHSAQQPKVLEIAYAK